MNFRVIHPLLKIIIGIVTLFVASVFIQFPTFPLSGDIEYIEITYRDFKQGERTFEVSDPNQIRELQQACEFAWTSIRGNSWEGNPSWMLKFDGKKIYIDQNEFGSSSRPPKELLKLLREKYS